jgi:hypothetical protein
MSYNEELHNWYFSPNISVIKQRKMRGAGHVACMKNIRNAYTILFGKPEWKRPRGRNRRRWEDNIEVDLNAK